MIHEYAIDPELVIAWGKDRADYRYFCEQFGLGTPRMMGEFPNFNNWRKQFKRAAIGADETNELPRITAIFNLIQDQRIRRDGIDYDGTLTWLENAENENKRYGFQAILSMDNPRDHAQVLSSTVLGDLMHKHPLWHVKSQSSCNRQAKQMADLLSPLFTNCSELHFVDPHFGPQNIRHRRPLAKFMEKVAHFRPRRLPMERIVIHVAVESFKGPDFRKECEKKLPDLIPIGLKLELKRWKQRNGGEKLHNRYILTDIGGVKIDPGLDDGKDGESFEVILLERKPYEKQLDNYVRSPAFDLAEQVTVIGAARMNR